MATALKLLLKKMLLMPPQLMPAQLHRVDEDVSGLTFEEWDPSTESSETPVVMIVNSSVRSAGFDLREVIPLQLETVSCGGQRTHDVTLKQIHGMGTRRYVLSVDNDNEFRSRCE